MAADPEITAVVLAGGKSERMGGSDKGLAAAAGRPLVTHVLRRVAPTVAAVVISANRHFDTYGAFGFPVVCDAFPDFRGPLAGVLAGAGAAATPLVLVVPCDLPLLPADLAPRLRRSLGTHSLAVARTSGGIEHAVMLFRRNLAADLAEYLAAGGRSIQGWQGRHDPVYADFPDPNEFVNVNSPEELKMVEGQISPSLVSEIRILCIGSPLGDDAIGLEVAPLLQGRFDPACVSVSAHDRPGADLVHLMRGAAAVILVDAVRAGAPAGTVLRLTGTDVPHALARHTSTHGFGVADAIRLAEKLGELPARLVLVGVEAGGDTGTAVRLAQAVELEVRSLLRLRFPAAG